MKIFWIAVLLSVVGCSADQAEEFVFRKSMEMDLVKRCGDKNEGCITAVKEQIKPCMEESNWKSIIDNEGDKEVMKRFVSKFYSCFKAENGEPYFPSFENI